MIIKNKKGYTLIELVVTVAIIGIMSTVVYMNFESTRSSNVGMTAQKLASDIRKVQNYSLSLKDGGGLDSSKGWGVYLEDDKSYYTLYIDDGGNLHSYDSATDNIEEIYLSKGVKIDNIEIDGADKTNASVLYVPPDPKIFICDGSNCVSTTTVITLIDAKGATSSVEINNYGLIDVD